ncbi:MAG: glycosyltransferase family 39 protein, partial [Chloroflexi bacterium]|nr:glycosyltransferase family 39 protein [Chloroflexota bacterium]
MASTVVRKRWHTLAWALLLTAIALMARLHRLDAFITPDEFKWVCRSVNFYRGLAYGDLARTLQTGHPGVLTMWLGVPWMGLDPTEGWLGFCVTDSVSDIIEAVPIETTHRLAAALFAARRGVALLTALAVAGAFWLLDRLFDRRIALLAGLLIALDPFFVAHSRFLHLDAILTGALFLSALSLLAGLRERSRGLLALSGVLGGLAVLQKSPGMFVLPYAALVIGGWGLLERRRPAWFIGHGLLWLAPLLFTYGIMWPSMWVQPLATLKLVFDTATDYAGNPHEKSNYFWGAPRPDPGPAFYPVALLFRLTPWSLLGALLALPQRMAIRPKTINQAERARGENTACQRWILWALAAFVVFYTLFMTLGQKKFDRYLLPVFPFVDALAAVGLVALGDRLASRRPRWRKPLWGALGGMVALSAVALSFIYSPYYLAYYNPLVGGPRTAVRTLLVGWGEGLELAAHYLNNLPDVQHTPVASRALPGFAAYYRGPAYDEGNYDPANTRYVVVYLNDAQRRLSPEILERFTDIARPEYVARIHGI